MEQHNALLAQEQNLDFKDVVYSSTEVSCIKNVINARSANTLFSEKVSKKISDITLNFTL